MNSMMMIRSRRGAEEKDSASIGHVKSESRSQSDVDWNGDKLG